MLLLAKEHGLQGFAMLSRKRNIGPGDTQALGRIVTFRWVAILT